MRKMNVLLGALAVGVGVIVGTTLVSSITNQSSQGSFISKLRGQNNISTVNAGVNGNAQPQPQPQLSADAGQNQNQGESVPAEAGSIPSEAGDSEESLDQEKLQIVADYKQNIGIFFGAWKSADTDTFRLRLSKAYVGELLDKHVKRAEAFIVQGVGQEATEIIFDRVEVEYAETNTATLNVQYRYTVRDYSLADRAPFGEEHEQKVKMKVTLLKQNSRWLITGESSVV